MFPALFYELECYIMSDHLMSSNCSLYTQGVDWDWWRADGSTSEQQARVSSSSQQPSQSEAAQPQIKQPSHKHTSLQQESSTAGSRSASGEGTSPGSRSAAAASQGGTSKPTFAKASKAARLGGSGGLPVSVNSAEKQVGGRRTLREKKVAKKSSGQD